LLKEAYLSWSDEGKGWVRQTWYHPPMDADKYYEGLLLKQEGKTTEALEAFEAAAGDDPASAPAWNEIGLLYDEDGRAAAAARCYQRAVTLDPAFAKAWNNWGVTCFLRGEYPEAKEKFLRALTLDSTLESARLNLSDTEEEMG